MRWLDPVCLVLIEEALHINEGIHNANAFTVCYEQLCRGELLVYRFINHRCFIERIGRVIHVQIRAHVNSFIDTQR